MPDTKTYPIPKHGWTCYHCGETFTTWGSAQDHFGATPDREPGCLIRVKYGDERGLEMELRKAEASADEWRKRALLAEAEHAVLARELSEYQRIAGSPSVNDLRMKLDHLEGRVVTADALIEGFRQRAPLTLAEIIG